jgi:hypothetical protein
MWKKYAPVPEYPITYHAAERLGYRKGFTIRVPEPSVKP